MEKHMIFTPMFQQKHLKKQIKIAVVSNRLRLFSTSIDLKWFMLFIILS